MHALSAQSVANPKIAKATLWFGFSLFAVSFALPAVGDLKGIACALFALLAWGSHDNQISSLAVFGALLNPEVLALFLLSILQRAPRLRAVLSVVILFSVPMTWIAIHRMNAAGMFMELRIGHFVWIIGIVVIVLADLQSAFTFSFARWVAGAAGAIVAVVSVPYLIALTMHPASGMDVFYYVVAWNLKEPAICGKIDRNAIGREDQREFRADLTYMQSDCYRNVAAMLHRPDLCDNVRSARADRLLGSVVADFSCRKQKYTVGTAMPGAGPDFVLGMRSVGYGDQELTEFPYQNRPDNYLYPVLAMLRTDSSFLRRLEASPSYDEPLAPGQERDAHPLEYVDEMVAVQWDLPSLCQKISPNARVRSSTGYAGSLRATCYSYIAFNRRDDSLCRTLAPAKNSLEANQGDFREGCMRNVAVLRNPNSHLQWAHYGPGYFPAWTQFQEAAHQLGYPHSAPWLQLPNPTPQDYENYLWYLAEPEHSAARSEFVRRVLARQ